MSAIDMSSPSGLVTGPLGLVGGMWQMIQGEQNQDVMGTLGGGLKTAAGAAQTLGAVGAVAPWLGPAAGALAGGFGLGRQIDDATGLSDWLSGDQDHYYAGSIAQGRARIARAAQPQGVREDVW